MSRVRVAAMMYRAWWMVEELLSVVRALAVAVVTALLVSLVYSVLLGSREPKEAVDLLRQLGGELLPLVRQALRRASSWALGRCQACHGHGLVMRRDGLAVCECAR